LKKFQFEHMASSVPGGVHLQIAQVDWMSKLQVTYMYHCRAALLASARTDDDLLRVNSYAKRTMVYG
jgi:hypothetical protein